MKLVWVAMLQGVYYFLTGVWPLLSLRTFMWVTGPKRERWLVRTVGVLIAVIGGTIAMAGWRQAVSVEIGLLGVGCAAGLGAIDVIYPLRGTISKIYLADAAAEGVLIGLWIWAWRAPG